MQEQYILSVDLGTTGCKVAIFTKEGHMISLSYSEYPLYTSKEGYAEQDPNDWWNAVVSNIKAALYKKNISPSSIRAIGVTGQSTSVVLLGNGNAILRPAILYMDARAENYLAQMIQSVGNINYVEIKFYSNLLWLRDHEPRLYKKIAKIIDAKEFIAMKLTGKVTYDSFPLKPDRVKKMNDAFDIPSEFFGTPHDYKSPTGYLQASVSKQIGIEEGIPVIVGPWDGMCNVIGSGLIEDGLAMDVAGTTEIVAMSSSKRTELANYNHLIDNLWLVYTSLPLAISYKWLRDNVAGLTTQLGQNIDLDPYNILNMKAAESTIGASGLLFIPTMQGSFMKPHLKGAYLGIKTSHTLSDLSRAVLEGIAYHLRWMLEDIEQTGLKIKEVRVSGGGSKSQLWNKIKADVLNKPIKIISVPETGCLGIAILASSTIGWYGSILDASKSMIKFTQTIMPNKENHKIYTKVYQKYRKAFDLLDDFFSE